jgi:protein PET100
MFPIGFMYYFGTNLDNRFSVPNFWPKPEECNTVPHDREELKAEYERIVARQKLRQARILEDERNRFAAADQTRHNDS